MGFHEPRVALKGRPLWLPEGLVWLEPSGLWGGPRHGMYKPEAELEARIKLAKIFVSCMVVLCAWVSWVFAKVFANG